MFSAKIISYFVVITTALLIGFDIYLATDDIKGNTYSQRIRKWSKNMKWFPFVLSLALGALVGHWFL